MAMMGKSLGMFSYFLGALAWEHGDRGLDRGDPDLAVNPSAPCAHGHPYYPTAARLRISATPDGEPEVELVLV